MISCSAARSISLTNRYDPCSPHGGIESGQTAHEVGAGRSADGNVEQGLHGE
jgi:hypothetical protein